jgi:hypothetical protein
MKDKRSRGDKKSREKRQNESQEQSPRSEHESTEQHDKADHEEDGNVTERFEVTITKMNVEDGDDGTFKISSDMSYSLRYLMAMLIGGKGGGEMLPEVTVSYSKYYTQV